jgi:hypothetical protein
VEKNFNMLPPLRGALDPKERFDLSEGPHEDDLVHLLAEVAGRPAGTIWTPLGFCLCCDEAGQPYQLRLYVPLSPGHATTYAGREASRFPVPGQVERWFRGVHMRFTEVDVTDYADSLALERISGGIVVPMYPTTQHARRSVGLRKAA